MNSIELIHCNFFHLIKELITPTHIFVRLFSQQLQKKKSNLVKVFFLKLTRDSSWKFLKNLKISANLESQIDFITISSLLYALALFYASYCSLINLFPLNNNNKGIQHVIRSYKTIAIEIYANFLTQFGIKVFNLNSDNLSIQISYLGQYFECLLIYKHDRNLKIKRQFNYCKGADIVVIR